MRRNEKAQYPINCGTFSGILFVRVHYVCVGGGGGIYWGIFFVGRGFYKGGGGVFGIYCVILFVRRAYYKGVGAGWG